MRDYNYLDQPFLCADGKFGLVIRDAPDLDEVGVQVPGEENIRWIKKMTIRGRDSALYEIGKKEKL
jgi:hypothetical protein